MRFTLIEWLVIALIVGIVIGIGWLTWYAIFGESDAERARSCLEAGGQFVQVNRTDFTCWYGGNS